jgi:uncharacterized protein YycO
MREFLLLFTLISASLACYGQDWKTFKFESGDLLFQDMDCGELCDAIKTVTPTSHDRHPSHVGLAYVVKDSVWVIEAWEDNVHLIPLRQFLFRDWVEEGRPKVMVGRVPAEYQNLAGRAVGFALEQRGRPYDPAFEYDNGKYYGAELVFDAYKTANKGKALFDIHEMNFSDPKNWKVHPFWKTYFEDLKVKVPEGKTGFNAAALANDDNVEIVISFY